MHGLKWTINSARIVETLTAGTHTRARTHTVVRVVNTGPVAFPMRAAVVPHSINQNMVPGTGAVLGGDVVLGGDMSW